MVRDVLPTGIRGIVVAGLLAALMSSLAGVFNACSTLFTIDFYSKFRPGATQAQLVWIGRVATAVMVLIGLLWIPVIQGAKGLYDYLQGVQGYLGPPIFTVFFLGVFMKRLNGAGSLAALIVGFAWACSGWRSTRRSASAWPATRPATRRAASSGSSTTSTSRYYSVLIFFVSAATMIGVSYATAAPSDEQIKGLTFATVTPEQKAETRRSWNQWDVINSGVVLALILIAYVYFSG